MKNDTSILIEALLKDPDWKERRKAARHLGMAKSESAEEALLAATNDIDDDVSCAAILSLVKLNSFKLLDLIIKPKILLSDNECIRWAAAYSLGLLGNTMHIRYLCELVNDSDWSVRNEALSALERLMLLVRKSGPNESRLLENIKLLILMLRVNHTKLHGQIIETLVQLKLHSTELLTESLSTNNENIKIGVITAIGEIRNINSVPHLIPHIIDDSPEVRKAVVGALGKIGSNLAINAIIERLGDGNREVVEVAINSIVSIKDDEMVDIILIENLRNISDIAIKKNILYCMGEIRDASMVKPILDNLGSSYYYIRTAAANAIAKFGESIRADINRIMDISAIPVEPLIKEAVEGENVKLRIKAINALGQLKHPQAYKKLRKLTQDSDNAIADAAQNALAHIMEATWERANGAYVLGEIGGEQSVQILLGALRDFSPEVRYAAVTALSKIKEQNTAEHIAELAVNDASDDVRQKAVRTLGDIGYFTREMKDTLLKTAGNKSYLVRSEAVRVLGKIPNDDNIDVLLDALKDRSFKVRKNALNALYNVGESIIPKLLKFLQQTDEKYIKFNILTLFGILYSQESLPELEKAAKTETDLDIINKYNQTLHILKQEHNDKNLLSLSYV
ncbi:MAG: HEAT repeat domain-containing protein [Actinobacteria bacterium]|nr:HEAT repeat domain-containing protein [Actinomycetota bacterium]